MKTQVIRRSCVCVALFAGMFWIAPAISQDTYQISRRGNIVMFRKNQRPTLIETLTKKNDPVELTADEFAQLKAYLVATSRPRRIKNDRFYQNKRAEIRNDLQNMSRVFEDPIQISKQFPDIARARDWERLRMHFIYNAELRSAAEPRKGDANQEASNGDS